MMRKHGFPVFIEFDPAEFSGPVAGEKRLHLAVLNDAIGCLLGAFGKKRDRLQLRRDAVEWLTSNDEEWPLSFIPTCETLGLPWQRMREALLAEKPKVQIVFDRLNRSHRLTALPVQEVRAAVTAGTPLYQVARRYGVQQRVISLMAGDIVRKRRARRDAEIRRAHFQDGVSYRDLALKFRVSKSTVERVCARVEPPPRRRRRAA